MKMMGISITSLSSLSIVLEIWMKYWMEEPWLGRLNLFIFMAEGNIEAKHISSKPTSLTFTSVFLILLILAITILNASKQKLRRYSIR